MNFSVENVLLFALVVCALYFLINRCECTEGMKNSGDPDKSLQELGITTKVDNKTMFDITILNLGPNQSSDTIEISYGGPHRWYRRTLRNGFVNTDNLITDQEQLTLLQQIYKYTGINQFTWVGRPEWIGYDYMISFQGRAGKIRFWDDTGDIYRITVYREGDTHNLSYNSKRPKLRALYSNHACKEYKKELTADACDPP